MGEIGKFRVVGVDTVLDNAKGTIRAFARIGYKLPEAIADIVDNSVDAAARHILIRFFCSDSAIRRVAIVDDGCGMSEASLLHAMQFGADVEHAASDLGKFGMGLKAASFSQCRSLSVLTMHRGKAAGRRWTVANIEEGWRCERLHPDDAAAVLKRDWGAVKIRKQGTVVLWDELDRFHVPMGTIEVAVKRLRGQLQQSLGVVYHRFLTPKGLAIRIDAHRFDEELAGIAQPVLPIDPFSYPKSGNKHYPKTFLAKLGKHSVKLRAHIWTPRSKAPEYSLGGSAAAKQGFYFYRNNRLIQVGGWNQLRGHESEPHLSLARVAVDLPPALDSLFQLNVQKSALVAPPDFDVAVEKSTAGAVKWAEYLRDAQNAYRRGEDAAEENAPIVMGRGVPSNVRSTSKKELTQGAKRQRKIGFKWTRLAPHLFFDIDRDKRLIKVNELYRKRIAAGGKGARDGAVAKTLLFLLTREEFNRERVRQERQEWLDSCNKMLIEAISG
jgi:hypothetical protein